ncbi:methyltransferase domain-containing protein [Stenotrophomonas tuberculopleuritidis]|uniref:methyltransferase domain-containing protein n=1 Tax=Stenotrophomonas tuberculopleuritidis TaxID=3055079 RepID=UPI0026E5124A|nr:methyltransferase domain-containing protein [Stenotrophomonas sp. 704A1]
MENYDNGFAPDNVYGHIADLLASFDPAPGQYFLDFGCGFGRLAEVVVQRHGVHYIGFDINQSGLASLRKRGFQAVDLDLGDVEEAFARVLEVLPDGAQVCALCTIDTMEHLPDPLAALNLLGRIARQCVAPLLVSVPNVAHLDIGAKLLIGRFDYTEAGLLDHTHMQYFTSERFSQMMNNAGWHEVGRNDVQMIRSDQHFPAMLPVLSPAAPLALLLAGLRAQRDEFAHVNQFVRAYLQGPAVVRGERVPYVEQREPTGPFLSVVIRTVGKRVTTLRESLLCLSAQTCQDFEVIIAGHSLDVERQIAVEGVIEELHADLRQRTRLLKVDGGGRSAPLNAGFLAATGRYVAAFDDDDLLFGDWVERFKGLESSNPGQLLRATAIAQDWDRVRQSGRPPVSRAISGMKALYPPTFELLAHIVENRTPLHSIAFPRVLFSELGYRFDPELSTAEDWDLIIRVAPLCGVACTPAITAMYRLWKDGDNSASSHDQFEWKSNYIKTLRKIDNSPLLLPAKSAVKLRKMYLELERLQGMVELGDDVAFLDDVQTDDAQRLAALRDRYHDLVTSKSWQITSPIRVLRNILAKRPWQRDPKVWQMSERDLEYRIRMILASSSWRWTRILRGLKG